MSIKQDFYAKIVSHNLVSLTIIPAQEQLIHKYQKRQLTYQINFAQALSKMKHKMVYLISIAFNKKVFYHSIIKLINYISLTSEAVRADRHFIRKLKNIKNDIHFSQYKSTL